MPQFSLIKRITALLSVAFTISAVAATPVDTSFKVKFRTLQNFMVIVPVTLNGVGPFNFLLDTGTSRTMVDRKIADQLSLPRVAESIAVGTQGDLSVSLVHSESVSMGRSIVHDLTFTVLPKSDGLPEGVSGILGEDFLERFDLLIDYRHHLIELQSGGAPTEMPGERLPIALQGMMHGHLVIGRLILSAHALELGRGDVSLLLDSGINSLVLFGGPESLGAGTIQQSFDIAGSLQSKSGVSVYSKTIRELRLGNKIVRNVTALAPPARVGMDTDGLLPTSVFDSIFICHSEKFVILDPSTAPTARQVK